MFQTKIEERIEAQLEVVAKIQKALSRVEDSDIALNISKSLEINVHALGFLLSSANPPKFDSSYIPNYSNPYPGMIVENKQE
jgi:hypothetical protein